MNFMQTILERAKIAFNIYSDKELAEKLRITASSISGYKNRGGNLSLELCIEVAKETGVSLDWLILGMGTSDSGSLIALSDDAEEMMMMAGWRRLNREQKDAVFQQIHQFVKK